MKTKVRCCLQCGEEFILKKRPQQRLCSKVCAGKHHSSHATLTQKCPTCDTLFTSLKWERKKYCSMECFRTDKQTRTAQEIENIRRGGEAVRKTIEWKIANKAHLQRLAESIKGKPRNRSAVEKTANTLRGVPQTAPGSARGETNRRSVAFYLRDPNGCTHRGKNLLEFVRRHEQLFSPEDVVWSRITPTKTAVICRAYKGLLSLRRVTDTPGSWKGWTLVSFTETFYNEEQDLLERNAH